MNFNKTILAGNLTANPETKSFGSGTSLANLRLAVNETFRTREGAENTRTLYMDVTVWGKQAETCAKFLKKGSPVLIEGALQMDEWESKTGEKRTRIKLKAERVAFLPDAKPAPAREPAEAFH